jgi:hypothetical protein
MLKLRIWVALVVLTGVSLSAPKPARADGTCAERHVCVWKDANFSGCKATLSFGSNSWKDTEHWDDCPGSPADEASSFMNRSVGSVWFATKPNGKGSRLCAASGASGNVPTKFNDRFESHAVYGEGYDPHCEVTVRS